MSLCTGCAAAAPSQSSTVLGPKELLSVQAAGLALVKKLLAKPAATITFNNGGGVRIRWRVLRDYCIQ